MKKIILLAILSISIQVNAQWFNKTIKGNGNVITKTIKTDDYESVIVSGFFDVFLVAGTEGNISIKAEDNLMKYIIVESNNGRLKIKLEKNINLKTKKGIYITVPFADLEEVILNGSGDIISKNTIKTDDFTTKLSGSGDINLDIDADKVTSKISGSGDITITGNSAELNTSITGSGDFVSKALKTNNVKVIVTGSGDATVYADAKIDAKVIGSGDIVFYGNPAYETTKIIGSGDITAR